MTTDTAEDARHADVVVGVDGSEPSIRALIWALRAAHQHDWSLEVVTAWPEADSLLVHDVPGHFSAPRQRAFVAQDAALARAREAAGYGTPLRALVVNAHPVEALAARAGGARLLVVGSHRDATEPFGRHHERAPVGVSVASVVRCPVVVVHGDGAAPPYELTQHGTRQQPIDVQVPAGTARKRSAGRGGLNILRRTS